MTDPWRTVKLPLSVRDQFREAIMKVGKASDIKIEEWGEAGMPGSGVLTGGQVAALEQLCSALNQMSVGQVRAFLVAGSLERD